MKKKLVKLLSFCIRNLEALRLKYSLSVEEKLPYSSLSPINHGDDNGHYSKALLWALKNRKEEDIKNIALTGSYGSGKSSILKTFQNNYKGTELKFLNISLATFKEEKSTFDENGKEIQIDKTNLLRLIETSILEQIFYHEEDRKIPDSRFKKIKSYSSGKLLVLSFGYSLFLLSVYNYLNPKSLGKVFIGITINNVVSTWIHYIGIVIIVLGIFFIILKSVRIISSITINKFEIQNAEIGVGENLNKSVLNHHVDEILYFFSVRPYNVVIIEDLDRFQETEIFTKLREVNLLLNNSEKTRRKEIVFVYAVRDDMFTEKERTKFFDFIIPVIPVINSSNSSEILLKKRNQFKFDLSDNLIEDLSFFIDDMRLLHNISNEFYLYREKLNENLNQDKLFAIITYKNIYPNDFMKLSRNEGDLFGVFSLKTEFIKNNIDKIDNEIDQYKEQIKQYENVFIDNIKDLRLLYILRIMEKLSGFQSFVINGAAVSVDEMVEDTNFEYVKTNKYRYNRVVKSNYYPTESNEETTPTFKFNEIERKIDLLKTYEKRETEIQDIKSGKIASIKEKIQDLEKLKQKSRNSKIAELLRSHNLSEIETITNLDISFLNILLRNGYIAEDYIDYISLFHEESITRSDYQFHISIKNEVSLPFEYKIFKVEKLLSKINPLDFKGEYIFNYDILDYLLANEKKYNSQLESIFDKLKDETKTSIEFIEGYFQISQMLSSFLRILCSRWINIWGFIESNSEFSDELKKAFFKGIIEYGDVTDIVKISKQSSFKKTITSNELFLNIINDNKKLKKIIIELKIIFDRIDFENSSDEMLDFIYQKKHYLISEDIIVGFIKKNGKFNQYEFDNSNFFAIKTSESKLLIQYIEENIDEYIENVYLKNPSNINEQEEFLIELLNNEDLDFSLKERVIEQVETKISKLSLIVDFELFPFLLENNRIVATWENLLYEYSSQKHELEDKELSDSSIEFINFLENAEKLSKVKTPKDGVDKDLYKEFWRKVLIVDEIEDTSYDLITQSNPWWYSDLDIERLSENKIKSLINNSCLKPTKETFSLLKNHFDGMNIYLLEKRKKEYLEILNQLTFDSEDLELILKSAILNNSEKLKLLNSCSEDIVKTDNNLVLLSIILSSDNSFVVNDEILTSLLKNTNIPDIERVKLFNKNSPKYDVPFINPFLTSLGGNYAWITDTNSKAIIPKTEENWKLLNILKIKGYISSFSERDSDYRVNHKRR